MNVRSSVLLYGHDEMLLLTRSLVLRQRGYRVRATVELSQLSRLLAREHVGLIILCHSLSRTECVMAGMIAKTRSEAPTLLICGNRVSRQERCMDEVADDSIDSMLGPELLLEKIDAMVYGNRQQVIRERMPRPYLITGAA